MGVCCMLAWKPSKRTTLLEQKVCGGSEEAKVLFKEKDWIHIIGDLLS